ncbi:ABC transporter, partial [Streptomyces niveus]
MTENLTAAGVPRRAGSNARSAISAVGLRKSYGEKLVLDGVDLEVGEGSVFALL